MTNSERRTEETEPPPIYQRYCLIQTLNVYWQHFCVTCWMLPLKLRCVSRLMWFLLCSRFASFHTADAVSEWVYIPCRIKNTLSRPIIHTSWIWVIFNCYDWFQLLTHAVLYSVHMHTLTLYSFVLLFLILRFEWIFFSQSPLPLGLHSIPVRIVSIFFSQHFVSVHVVLSSFTCLLFNSISFALAAARWYCIGRKALDLLRKEKKKQLQNLTQF